MWEVISNALVPILSIIIPYMSIFNLGLSVSLVPYYRLQLPTHIIKLSVLANPIYCAPSSILNASLP